MPCASIEQNFQLEFKSCKLKHSKVVKSIAFLLISMLSKLTRNLKIKRSKMHCWYIEKWSLIRKFYIISLQTSKFPNTSIWNHICLFLLLSFLKKEQNKNFSLIFHVSQIICLKVNGKAITKEVCSVWDEGIRWRNYYNIIHFGLTESVIALVGSKRNVDYKSYLVKPLMYGPKSNQVGFA